MTVTQANALSPLPQQKRIFPAHGEGEASVLVLRAEAGKAPTPERGMPSFMDRSLADLALVDVQTHEVRRIASKERILWYGFSPDQRYVAYTRLAGEVPNSEDIRYDIELVDLRSGQHRRIAQDLPMNYGIELNWSPDGHSLAVVEHDSQGKASLGLIPLDGTPARRLDRAPPGSLDEVAPHWDPSGRFLFVTAAGGHLWRIDAVSGAAQELASRPGVEIAALVSKFDQPTAWTTNKGSQLWAIAYRRDSQQYSALCIDVESGRIKSEVQLVGGIETGPNIDATNHGNRIAFVASDQRHPEDLWVYSPADHHIRQLSHLNPDLERYELGEARIITFHAADGRTLRASLLLPPGYLPGQRLPTVVWVYGGENGSEAAQTFGLAGRFPVFDMHVLATRGYAVLFPDSPLSPGTPVKDLVAAVMPAVDAAIEQGYSDPQRLAVMGHS